MRDGLIKFADSVYTQSFYFLLKLLLTYCVSKFFSRRIQPILRSPLI